MMEITQTYMSCARAALAGFCLLLAGGCAPSTNQDNLRLRSPAPASACPSTDFTKFLQLFADVDDGRLRQKYTADPLEYELPTHVVEEESADSPVTRVMKVSGDARFELFPYRYLPGADAYGRQAADDAVMPVGMATYPLETRVLPGEGREVVIGMEYEVDTYRFELRNGCWVLTRAINLRD